METPLIETGQPPKQSFIVVFANQKGGVGKTSLCTLFANYLVEKKHPVVTMDCDGQQSIYKRRNEDLKLFPDAHIKYNVQAFDITDAVNTQQLMDRARMVKGTVIIDTPGSLSKNGLIPIFTQADIIVCPTAFDYNSSKSTADFYNFETVICKKVGCDMPPFYFIINRFQKGWGKKKDLEMWTKMEQYLSEVGKVTPKVIAGADMTRINTLISTPRQKEMTNPAFDFIYNDIKDRLI